MNMYIENLVKTLYKSEQYKYNHHLNIGKYLSFSERLNEIFETTDNKTNFNTLYQISEEYHICNVFDIVLNHIVEVYKENKHKVFLSDDFIKIYTGYNFNANTSLCNKLNNECIKYPIYVYIGYDEKSTVYAAALTKAESNDKIIIELNSAQIKDDENLLRSSCKHEFLHIRESYAKEYIDVLQSNKNRLHDNDIENIFNWNNSYNFFLKSIRICYLFNKA